MAKQKLVDKRAVVSTIDRQTAMLDPRMPQRVDVGTMKPKDLPGMNGKKIRSMEQLKSYLSRIPACPRETR
jgi:hypothetical protein